MAPSHEISLKTEEDARFAIMVQTHVPPYTMPITDDDSEDDKIPASGLPPVEAHGEVPYEPEPVLSQSQVEVTSKDPDSILPAQTSQRPDLPAVGKQALPLYLILLHLLYKPN